MKKYTLFIVLFLISMNINADIPSWLDLIFYLEVGILPLNSYQIYEYDEIIPESGLKEQ